MEELGKYVNTCIDAKLCDNLTYFIKLNIIKLLVNSSVFWAMDSLIFPSKQKLGNKTFDKSDFVSVSPVGIELSE